MGDKGKMTRREWFAGVLAGAGLLASYGLLAAEGLMFLLPSRTKPKTRKIFAGQINEYKVGSVQSVADLQGNPILIRRDEAGFSALSSTCPHLGCKVSWEKDKNHFLCPCHNGIFDETGKGISGPPGDAGQRLLPVPIEVEESSGVVFIEVDDIQTGGRS